MSILAVDHGADLCYKDCHMTNPSAFFERCPAWLHYAALLLLCLILYLPGLTTIPPIDRDEPRYARPHGK